MKSVLSCQVIALGLAAMLFAGGCTMFTDDLYKLQSGQYASGNYSAVERAIYHEMAERFGEGHVFRARVESRYNHWTAVSEQLSIGHDKYRLHVTAYPNLDGDGHFEPIVIARQQMYVGASWNRRASPTANYSNKWMELGRDTELEVAIANSVYQRLRDGHAGGQ